MVLFVPDTVCLSVGPLQLLGGSPEGGVYSGDGMNNEIFDPVAAGLGQAIITYSYTDDNNCSGTDEAIIYVDQCLEIKENSTITFTAFPNPTNGQLQLIFSEEIELNRIVCLDLQGRITKFWDLKEYCTVKELSLTELPSGMYYLMVIADKTTIRMKVELLK